MNNKSAPTQSYPVRTAQSFISPLHFSAHNIIPSIMTINTMSNTYVQQQHQQQPKRKSKASPIHRRRVTVDSPCLVSRPKISRRASLSDMPKNVQFSRTSEVCVIETSPTRTKQWYTGDDHRRFKKERITDVASLREQSRQKAPAASSAATNSFNPPDDTCPVGIEQLLSTKGAYEAAANRKQVIQSVLYEQNRQRLFGVHRPDQLAYLSVHMSAEALDGALKRGKFQEMAKFI